MKWGESALMDRQFRLRRDDLDPFCEAASAHAREVVGKWICSAFPERTVGTKTSTEKRYYISSLPADAKRIAHAVRSHWEVENRLHWCLDVQFNEDQSTVRTGFAANNLAIVRHIVINLLRLNKSRKGSIKTKRMLAATSDAFRAELLGVMA